MKEASKPIINTVSIFIQAAYHSDTLFYEQLLRQIQFAANKSI